jgi:hypothetical protein
MWLIIFGIVAGEPVKSVHWLPTPAACYARLAHTTVEPPLQATCSRYLNSVGMSCNKRGRCDGKSDELLRLDRW